MTPNDDLARWGEPPASDQEMRAARELAERLDQARDRGITPPGDELLEVDSWLQLMVTTVLSYTGLAENAPCPADPGGPASAPPDLLLRVYRLASRERFVLVGSTHPAPATLRDLKRVPDDADRLTLRIGDLA